MNKADTIKFVIMEVLDITPTQYYDRFINVTSGKETREQQIYRDMYSIAEKCYKAGSWSYENHTEEPKAIIGGVINNPAPNWGGPSVNNGPDYGMIYTEAKDARTDDQGIKFD